MLNHEYKDHIHQYNKSMRWNDKVIGTILNLIEADQSTHIKGKLTAKEAWESLKTNHRHASQSGIILHQSWYADEGIHRGQNMHNYLTFFTIENHKLRTKTFDDEFLAQLSLMLFVEIQCRNLQSIWKNSSVKYMPCCLYLVMPVLKPASEIQDQPKSRLWE